MQLTTANERRSDKAFCNALFKEVLPYLAARNGKDSAYESIRGKFIDLLVTNYGCKIFGNATYLASLLLGEEVGKRALVIISSSDSLTLIRSSFEFLKNLVLNSDFKPALNNLCSLSPDPFAGLVLSKKAKSILIKLTSPQFDGCTDFHKLRQYLRLRGVAC